MFRAARWRAVLGISKIKLIIDNLEYNVNTLSKRPLANGDRYNSYFKNSSCKPSYLGTSDTAFTITQMRKWATKNADQVKELALKEFKGKSLRDTVDAIYNFLYSHFQYELDGSEQRLKSPACAWATREKGMDCKSYSIFASALLINLGIKHYFRRVKQPGSYPDKWTHVYVVVPTNQKNPPKGNPKDYLVIDATRHQNVEGKYLKNSDSLMSKVKLRHVGLQAPGLNGCVCTIKRTAPVNTTPTTGGRPTTSTPTTPSTSTPSTSTTTPRSNASTGGTRVSTPSSSTVSGYRTTPSTTPSSTSGTRNASTNPLVIDYGTTPIRTSTVVSSRSSSSTPSSGSRTSSGTSGTTRTSSTSTGRSNTTVSAVRTSSVSGGSRRVINGEALLGPSVWACPNNMTKNVGMGDPGATTPVQTYTTPKNILITGATTGVSAIAQGVNSGASTSTVVKSASGAIAGTIAALAPATGPAAPIALAAAAVIAIIPDRFYNKVLGQFFANGLNPKCMGSSWAPSKAKKEFEQDAQLIKNAAAKIYEINDWNTIVARMNEFMEYFYSIRATERDWLMTSAKDCTYDGLKLLIKNHDELKDELLSNFKVFVEKEGHKVVPNGTKTIKYPPEAHTGRHSLTQEVEQFAIMLNTGKLAEGQGTVANTVQNLSNYTGGISEAGFGTTGILLLLAIAGGTLLYKNS